MVESRMAQQLIASQIFQIEIGEAVYFLQDIVFVRHVLVEIQPFDGIIVDYFFDIFFIDIAVRIVQIRMYGDTVKITIHAVYGAAIVELLGIDNQPVAFREEVLVPVDVKKHFSLCDADNLDFLVPMTDCLHIVKIGELVVLKGKIDAGSIVVYYFVCICQYGHFSFHIIPQKTIVIF